MSEFVFLSLCSISFITKKKKGKCVSFRKIIENAKKKNGSQIVVGQRNKKR